jgi:hypothetical protein
MPDKDEYTWRELGIGFRRLGLFFGAIFVAVGIVIVVIVGEIQSLIALDAQHAEGWPFPATIILTVSVVVAPGAVLARSLRAYYRLLEESAAEAASAREPRTPPAGPETSPSGESDTTQAEIDRSRHDRIANPEKRVTGFRRSAETGKTGAANRRHF